MSKKIVAFDLDGVLFDFHKSLIRKFKDRHYKSFDLNDFHDFSFEKCLGPLYGKLAVDIINEMGWFANLEPFHNAKEVIRAVDKVHEIFVLTAPPKHNPDLLNSYSAHEKIECVSREFPEFKDKIIITRYKELVCADVLVDDGLHNIEAFCERQLHAQGILIDQPWNQTNVLPKNAVRATLDQVPHIIGV